MFTISPNDQSNADSVAVHGLSTLYNASDIVRIVNGGFRNFTSCYFYNF